MKLKDGKIPSAKWYNLWQQSSFPGGTNQDHRSPKQAFLPQLFSEAAMHIWQLKQRCCTEQRECCRDFQVVGSKGWPHNWSKTCNWFTDLLLMWLEEKNKSLTSCFSSPDTQTLCNFIVKYRPCWRWLETNSPTYLSVHEQMSHQSHGFPQRVPLFGDEGLVLICQATGTRHHELSDLVIQAVERLNGCKGNKDKMYMIILLSVWTLESQTLGTQRTKAADDHGSLIRSVLYHNNLRFTAPSNLWMIHSRVACWQVHARRGSSSGVALEGAAPEEADGCLVIALWTETHTAPKHVGIIARCCRK